MTATELLLHDPLVLEMADRNHQPTEVTTSNYSGTATCNVVCDQCGQTWPCRLRELIDRAKKVRLQEALDSIAIKKGQT